MSIIRIGYAAGKLALKGIKAYKKSKKIKPIVDKKVKPVIKDYAKETKGMLKDVHQGAVDVMTKIPGASHVVLVPTLLANYAVRKGTKKIVGSKIGKSTIKKGKSLKVKLKNWWKQQ